MGGTPLGLSFHENIIIPTTTLAWLTLDSPGQLNRQNAHGSSPRDSVLIDLRCGLGGGFVKLTRGFLGGPLFQRMSNAYLPTFKSSASVPGLPGKPDKLC